MKQKIRSSIQVMIIILFLSLLGGMLTHQILCPEIDRGGVEMFEDSLVIEYPDGSTEPLYEDDKWLENNHIDD